MPQITQLDNDPTPNNNDLLVTVDVGAGTTKNISREQFFTGAPLPANTVNGQAIADGSVTPAKRSGGFAVGVLTINTTGAKSVTGLGFQPKQIRFIGTFTSDNNLNTASEGIYDGTTIRSIAHASLGSSHASRYYDDRFAIVSFSGGTLATACRVDTISITSDGFTYNVASASTTSTIIYEAIA